MPLQCSWNDWYRPGINLNLNSSFEYSFDKIQNTCRLGKPKPADGTKQTAIVSPPHIAVTHTITPPIPIGAPKTLIRISCMVTWHATRCRQRRAYTWPLENWKYFKWGKQQTPKTTTTTTTTMMMMLIMVGWFASWLPVLILMVVVCIAIWLKVNCIRPQLRLTWFLLKSL